MPPAYKALLFKFLKFGIVGFSGLILDFAITFLAKEKLRLNKYVANSLGFSVTCTSNYLLNRAWTFQSENPEVAWQFTKYALVAVIGLGLNNLIIFLFTEHFRFNFYLAKFVAVVLVFFWNFSLNYLFIFVESSLQA